MRSHAQTRSTLQLALVAIGAAAVAWVVSDAAWLPLHLFLAGGVVLAISGVSLMLTVTWSAAPAPSDRVVLVQRACVAVGVAGVAAGRQLELGDAVVGIAGTLYLIGLVGLAVILVMTARRGTERRFDPAVVAYVAALAAGTFGVVLGVVMSVEAPSGHVRAAHIAVNVLGLVGLVIAGTLPFFTATVARARMAPHATARRIVAVVAWHVAALAVAVGGLVADVRAVAVGGLGAYALGIVADMSLMPRPTRRQLSWAGPRLLGLWCGALWWAAAVVATAIGGVNGSVVFEARWLAVLVVAGYAQILWGSLAYLLPMLRGGGHEKLSAGFAATRSWVGLAAANVAGVALAVDATPVAVVAVAVWVVDAAFRALRVGFGRLVRRPGPDEPAVRR